MTADIIFKRDLFADEQLKEIAILHQQGIPSGFLSTLGNRFLASLYDSIVRSPGGVLIAAIDSNNKVVGFVSGTTSIRSVYLYLAGHHLSSLIRLIFKHAFSVKTLRRIIETKRYSTQEPSKGKDTSAELLSIVVDARLQGMGIAQDLFAKFKAEFRQKRVDRFKITVGSQLVQAQKFYVKAGAIKISEIELHQDEPSFVYECMV